MRQQDRALLTGKLPVKISKPPMVTVKKLAKSKKHPN
jgi:hypothetical protein